MRILHFADVHLDRPFVGMPLDAAQARRRELFEAFRRCLAAAAEHGADLITIGGDLWEEEHVMPDTRRSVAHELGQLGVPVLLITGNHDPLLPGGSYERTAWPAKVTIARDSSPVECPFGDVSVWAVSWTGGDLSSAFLDRFHAPDDGRTHLLLLHGTCHGVAWFAEGGGYCSFTREQVERAGFAVCLAGHLHGASWDGGVCYPGSPEPLDWGETGRHCYALVDVESGEVAVELIDVNTRRYETIRVDCEDAGSSAEVAARLERSLDGLDDLGLCVRVALTGQVAPDCNVDPGQLEERFAGRFAVITIDDQTTPAYDLEALAARKTVDGRFVAKLVERLERASDDRERQTIERALQAGLRAMNGEKELLRVD